MKPYKSIQFSFFLFLLVQLSALNAQAPSGDCNLSDPLFGYEPDIDLCCSFQEVHTICYDIGKLGPPWVNIATEGPFTFVFQSTPQGEWNSLEEFNTYEELASLMNALSLSNGVSVDFSWDPLTQKLCADLVNFDYGFIRLCDGTSGECNSSFAGSSPEYVDVPPEITNVSCPITEPDLDIGGLFDNPATGLIEDLNIFNGSAGNISTQGILPSLNFGANYTGPSPSSIGLMLNAVVGSGALEYGAGCFNLNCINIESFADELNQGEVMTTLNDNIPGDPPAGYNSWSEYLNEAVDLAIQDDILGAYGSFTGYLNDLLGLSIPDQGPCQGEVFEPPFSGNASSAEKRKTSKPDLFQKIMMQAETEADMDYFSGHIPGLGLDGPGVAAPSPSAMAHLDQVKGSVDLFNGSQQTSIPLWTVQANDISIPVSISGSNNGLKVNDMGTLVGQQWDLNAGGMISRVVKGLPDEFHGATTGIGVGRTYRITPRFEIPSNAGLRVSFPGSENIGCLSGLEGIKQKIEQGFVSESVEFPNTPVQLSVSWTPLRPNLVNFTLSIPIHDIFGITVYIEIGFNIGIALNEQLGNINYREEGLGFLHLDDEQLMDEFGLGDVPFPGGNNDVPLISAVSSPDDKLEVLQGRHAHKNLEDVRFFNDQVAVWANWLEAIEALVNGTHVYDTRRLDTEPDEFHFNCGGYSGKFSFNVDGIPVLFPYYEGLSIESETVQSNGETHIASFTVTTPDGMEYTYGHSDFRAVDIKQDSNYYLPNFYTYPEVGSGRDRYGKAEIDISQLHYVPFFGPRRIVTYGNSYDRNYRIMESPRYSAAWHLVKVRSLLTAEEVDLNYRKRDVNYYADKSYTHTFPNFGLESTDEKNLTTTANGDLNQPHLIGTKWENGRAEFAYAVTETQLARWDLTDIQTSRQEAMYFTYGLSRREIVGDEVCSRIEVHRGGQLYKGWELEYMNEELPFSTATCNTEPLENPAPPAISIDGETRFDLGEKYDPHWFEYNSFFYINLNIGCFRLPFQIPISFLAGRIDFGYRTGLYEYGSLMEVKALNGIYHKDDEEAIFHAEHNRTFLQTIREIDRNGGLHPFVSITYVDDGAGLPRRFSVHQDLYGSYNDNSTSGSPLPPLHYQAIDGTTVTTATGGVDKHFGFYNVEAPGYMQMGQNETSDPDRAKTGAISTITLASGGEISYEYELNHLSDNGGVKGAGLRVVRMTEAPGETLEKVTTYHYDQPTIVNEPVRLYQTPKQYYYRDLEEKVVTTSAYQNMVYPNRNNHVGYETVVEEWKDVGKVTHHFTSPDNYSNHFLNVDNAAPVVAQQLYNENKSGLLFGNLVGGNTALEMPPSLRFVDELKYMTWLFGVEYRTEVWNADDITIRQESTTDFELHDFDQESLKYFSSEMYQHHFPGPFWANYIHRLVLNYQPFHEPNDPDIIDPLIDLLLDLILGTVVPHPYKRIKRNYFVSDRRLITCNFRPGSTLVTDHYTDGFSSSVTRYSYVNSPNPAIPKVVTTDNSDGIKTETENLFADESVVEILKFESQAIDYLLDIGFLSPLVSRTGLFDPVLEDYVLIKDDFTALTWLNGRLVPKTNWGLLDGDLHLIGTFTEWNGDGKPERYEIASYDENGNSTGTFPQPVVLSWNERLQLTGRDYGDMANVYAYNDYYELETSVNSDNISSGYAYDPRGRLATAKSLNNRQIQQYVYSVTPGDNRVTSTVSFTDDSHPDQTQVQYLDGFGKPLRLVRQNDGALLSDHLYDGYFRLVGMYNITGGNATIEHEASPLSRQTKVTDAEGNETVTEKIKGGYFVAEKVTDPNASTALSHFDALERLRQTVSGEGGSTQYFYDDLSRLDVILNPVSEQYKYDYNGMDRVMKKTIPGANQYKYWYDEFFRLVAVQDGNEEYLVYQYDDYNRLIQTFHHPDGIALVEEEEGFVLSQSMDAHYDPANVVLENQYDGLKSWITYSKEKIFSPDGDDLFKETHQVDIDDIGQVLQSEMTYPYGTVTVSTTYDRALLVNDVTKNITSPGAGLSVSHAYSYDPILRLKEIRLDGDLLSRLTYNPKDLVKTKLLGQWIDPETGEEKFLQEVDYFYDKTGRLVRINNPYTMECYLELEICDLYGEITVAGGIIGRSACDPILTTIEVDGQIYPVDPAVYMADIQYTQALIASLEAALDYAGHVGDVEVESYYSGSGEITYEISIANTTAKQFVLKNGSCEIGRLQLQDCCITEVPNELTGPEPVAPDNYDLFYEKITYSGIDISRIEYGSDCATGTMRNDYTYDLDHRVLVQDNTVFNPDRQDDWYTAVFTYDLAGNILTLKRNGMFEEVPGQPSYPLIDDLEYGYDVSTPGVKQLKTIDDLLDGDPQPLGFEPDELTISYDGNGNMLTGRLANVTWNVINMPMTATHMGEEIRFDYTFNGEKTRVQTPGDDWEDRLYLGGAELVIDEHTSIYQADNYQHEEGRKQFIRGEYEQIPQPAILQYQITDHLGNLAVLFTDADDDGHIASEGEASAPEDLEVLQRHYYYPFGMDMDGTWTRVEPYKDQYRYNHKELTRGLGWYAYGFRYYDATIGRFTGVDPLADHPYQVDKSPFAYAWNNPVSLIDPDGRCPICPFLAKAGANAAADYAAQTVMNYYFNSETAGDWGGSSGAVNSWQVTRSGLEGLIPWKTPGGRLGRAAGTAFGDVIANYLSDPGAYTEEKFYQDFAVGFIGDLAGGGLGELTSKYGSKAVARGLSNLPGFNAGKIRDLTGFDIIGDYAEKLANSLGGSVKKASGDGSIVNYGKYTVRIMYKGGERTSPYFRISKSGKGSIDATGGFNSDRGATHIDFSGDPTEQIQQIIRANEGL